MRTEWNGHSLEKLKGLKAAISTVNGGIFELSRIRGAIETEYEEELARILGKDFEPVLESHHSCDNSPTGRCVIPVALGGSNDCLFCGFSIHR